MRLHKMSVNMEMSYLPNLVFFAALIVCVAFIFIAFTSKYFKDAPKKLPIAYKKT